MYVWAGTDDFLVFGPSALGGDTALPGQTLDADISP